MPLTARQEHFVYEYLVDGCATAAARRAGYSSRTARAIGSENLTKPAIREAIAAAQAARAKRTEVTADRVIAELARIAFANARDYIRIGDAGTWDVSLPHRDAAAAVQELTITEESGGRQRVRVKLADKRAALVDLGRHFGLFQQSSGGALRAPPEQLDLSKLSDAELEALDAIMAKASRARH